ncbi:Fcf1-domain-containing protein [Coniella lustricola]|uniref:U three protein 23 n=1 Tax=Coniella lustricola TaxID=2025994 RepID=A0A2T2ZX73_9PEZI|nr:Fcf1-domain-containing protein [Coniella lustricola]
MRGKRSKAYRKLLKQFELAFNFRQPYQVLIDADLARDAHRFTMDLPTYLGNTLHGDVKVLITQCSMRHLYAAARADTTGQVNRVIDKAKDFERRRCGHHPDQFPEPLSTAECLGSVVGATNKHRYVVASQDLEVRAKMREIPGVPLVYISRSVMILEPMASATARVVQKGERAKFRAEIKAPASKKRKRQDGDGGDDDSDASDDGAKKKAEAEKKKKKKRKGEKGPNPLSVKKAKKKPQESKQESTKQPKQPPTGADAKTQDESKPADGASTEQPAKKKRKRKQKRAQDGEGGEGAAAVGGGGGGEETQKAVATGDDA